MKTPAIRIILISIILLIMVGCSKETPPEGPKERAVPSVQGAAVAALPEAEVSEVKILGKEGFSPAMLVIPKGTKVQFVNNEPKGKGTVLTFQKYKSRSFSTSPIIRLKESWEYKFSEPGEYEYWTVGYGVKGKITVK